MSSQNVMRIWRRPRRPSLAIAILCLFGWFLTFAKVGTGLDFSANDYVDRLQALPDILVRDDALVDYRNWSMLPLVVARLLGITTTTSFAFLQCVILVLGTTTILVWLSRQQYTTSIRATLALFATLVPSYTLFFMGSYDQLLVVLLLGAAIVSTNRTGLFVGLLIGLTHAEIGILSVAGLLAMSTVGLGPRVSVRTWTLIGIAASRLVLTVLLSQAGQSSSRFTFIDAYGIDRLLGYFGDTWPYILWTLGAGGWLIIGCAALRTRRTALTLIAILAVYLGASAITTDASRILMITSMPIVIASAVYADSIGGGERSAHSVDRPMRTFLPGAAVIGVLAPLSISWAGDVHALGSPFYLGW